MVEGRKGARTESKQNRNHQPASHAASCRGRSKAISLSCSVQWGGGGVETRSCSLLRTVRTYVRCERVRVTVPLTGRSLSPYLWGRHQGYEPKMCGRERPRRERRPLSLCGLLRVARGARRTCTTYILYGSSRALHLRSLNTDERNNHSLDVRHGTAREKKKRKARGGRERRGGRILIPVVDFD